MLRQTCRNVCIKHSCELSSASKVSGLLQRSLAHDESSNDACKDVLLLYINKSTTLAFKSDFSRNSSEPLPRKGLGKDSAQVQLFSIVPSVMQRSSTCRQPLKSQFEAELTMNCQKKNYPLVISQNLTSRLHRNCHSFKAFR